MSSNSDVLLALRQTVSVKGRKPQIIFKKGSATVSSFKEATHLVLANDLTVPKDAPTRLRKPGTSSTDPQANPQDFISLGAVYLAWKLREAPGADYMKQVRENGYTTGFVSVTERKGVVDWLQNKSQTLSGLVSDQGECPVTAMLVMTSVREEGFVHQRRASAHEEVICSAMCSTAIDASAILCYPLVPIP